MTLPLATTNGAPAPRFFIAGEWRDYGRQHGAIAMDNRDYTRLTGDVLRNEGAITLAPGARAEDVAAALRAKAPPNLAQRFFFIEPREIRASALRVFDRSFTVTYLLEAIALLVGLAGVAASFSAQTLARTKEFGMLRHIGVKKRQITLMLVGEGALLGIVGVTAGIGLGIAISQVLIHVVNPQSFHWTMDTKLPFELFAIVIVALVVAASGTALLAGRRALGIDAVRAVREDW
jgi:putative ABC transport system permease protein